MPGQSSAHAVTYPFLRKSFQTIGYTSTKSFLARRFSVLGNSSSVLPVKMGMRACGVPSPTIFYPFKTIPFKFSVKYLYVFANFLL